MKTDTMPGSATGPGIGGSTSLPLCVELEWCLVKTNLAIEGFLASARRLGTWLHLPARLLGGTAPDPKPTLDPALLPYNGRLIDYLKQERARGRHLVLVARGDRELADAIAAHVGLFDTVVMTGRNDDAGRLEAIRARLGDGAFAYAGSGRGALPVWQAAAQAVVVDADPTVVSAVRDVTTVEAVIDERTSLAKGLIKALRPHQWVKNVLVFVPMVAAGALFDWKAWTGSLIAFAAFCMTASAIYIINDLTDLAADRQHPRKRKRPFASGAVPAGVGLAMTVVLLAAGATLATLAGTLMLVASYALVSLSYSLNLKQRPLVDVFCLSLLYILRMFTGGEASGHRVSMWLLGFAFFLFLGLALMKRVAELSEGEQSRHIVRRGYYTSDTLMLALMGVAASFTSSVVLALYLQGAAVAIYPSPSMLVPLVPLLLFWQCRLWLSTHRGYMLDDPIVYSARDWVSWIVAALCAALVILAHQPGLAVL